MILLLCLFGLSPLILIAYAGATYAKTLRNEQNVWWLQGIGRYLGGALLLLAMKLAAWLPASIDKAQRKLALDKIRHLQIKLPSIGGVCFVGSSTFTYWTKLEHDMEQLGVSGSYNAAFGGSCSQHVLEFAKDLVFQWKPRTIVYYCGTNDYNLNRGPTTAALDNFELFVQQARKALPGVHIVYVAAIITPFVRFRGPSYINRFVEGNTLASAFCRNHGIEYVYPGSAAFSNDVSMYLGDMHHFNKEGHRRLGELIAAAIKRSTQTQS